MKAYFITGIFATVIVTCCEAKVFVPSNNTFIERKNIAPEKQSVRGVAKLLGFHTDQISDYFNLEDTHIYSVAFKVFTDEILFILTDESILSLGKDRVDAYLEEYDPDKKEFYEIETRLKNGIKNKSLSSAFLSEVLKEPNVKPNGIMEAKLIGYTLYFTNGFLSAFRSSDGLNKWAKDWKDNRNEVFELYQNEAIRYWGENKVKVIEEINIQFEAFSRMEGGGQNQYIPFHTNKEGRINFKMLLVAHYQEKITLKEFKDINHGRYELFDEFSTPENYKRATYRVDNTLFTFSEEGKLINTYTVK